MTIKFDALGDAEIRRIAQLVEILEKSGFDHLTLELEDFRLTVGTGDVVSNAPAAAAPAMAAAAPVAPSPATAASPAAVAGAPIVAAPAPEGTVEIKAPSMGRFYSRPDPASAPFVTVGGKVDPSSTVGLVEVMKLFNAVAAGVAGEIVQICVEDAALVEYDQVLMRVRPA
jgi:acetyl-CoA carboxylase biotin carboxyl carrier protein